MRVLLRPPFFSALNYEPQLFKMLTRKGAFQIHRILNVHRGMGKAPLSHVCLTGRLLASLLLERPVPGYGIVLTHAGR